MKKFVILILVFISLIITSCSSDDDQGVQLEQQVTFPEIIGEWEWVGTINGADDSVDGPELSGTTRDIVISEDEFIFYIDDNILAQRGYTFSLEESVLNGEEEFIVTFTDNGFRDIVRREDNFINFIDDCEGCYTSIYKLKD